MTDNLPKLKKLLESKLLIKIILVMKLKKLIKIEYNI